MRTGVCSYLNTYDCSYVNYEVCRSVVLVVILHHFKRNEDSKKQKKTFQLIGNLYINILLPRCMILLSTTLDKKYFITNKYLFL